MARWKARNRLFDSPRRHVHCIFILNFSFLPVADSSTKPIHMISRMTFILSKGCKEIDLLLNEYGDGLYYDLSALSFNFDILLKLTCVISLETQEAEIYILLNAILYRKLLSL